MSIKTPTPEIYPTDTSVLYSIHDEKLYKDLNRSTTDSSGSHFANTDDKQRTFNVGDFHVPGSILSTLSALSYLKFTVTPHESLLLLLTLAS